MYISFTHPLYLFFLFVIPLIVFFHFFGLKNLRGRSLKFANFEAIARVKGIDIYSKNLFVLIFNIGFILLLVMALSGFTLYKEVSGSEFSFVVAIDNSNSMSASDISPDRLEGAKVAAEKFVDSLPYESYVGVISFSGDSRIEQPLTKNKQELKYAIENLEISATGGTDIFEAVSNAGDILQKEKNKAIILISDGQINQGTLAETIDYAKYNKIVIHTFGIGTVEGGETSYGFSKLDEDSLKSLAYNTQGKYFNIKQNQDLENSFSEIASSIKILGSIDLSFYLIILSIILFLVKEFLLSINKIIW